MRSSGRRRRVLAFRPEVSDLERRLVLSLTIDVRYTLDTAGFFATAERRAAMERAANYVGSLLDDDLSAIQPAGTNSWSALLTHPSTGMIEAIPNLSVPARTLIVYVGGRDLPGAEKGNGGPGGFNASGSTSWLDVVTGRGQPGALLPTPTDSAPWGGSITFDSIGTNWYFGDSISGIQPTQTDFHSVAIHELAHVLGFGIRLPSPEVTSWSRYVSGAVFTGPNAVPAHGGQPVALDPNRSHWAEGTLSDGRETAMDPTLTQGTRKPFTTLDIAALKDLGWSVRNVGAIQFATAAFSVLEDAGLAEITLVRPTGGGPASLRLTTQGGTAMPGIDYLPVDTILDFASGETSKVVPIVIVDDTLLEGEETIGLVLSDFVNASGGVPTTATLTIHDRERGGSNDYDGNGVTDPGTFTIASALWNIQLKDNAGTTIGTRQRNYGIPGDYAARIGLEPLTDFPVPGDYNGDGITDFALFRSETAEYLISYLDLEGKVIATRVYQFGFPGWYARQLGLEPLQDIPIPGDYNGDGVYDLAVFRVETAEWIIRLKMPGFDFAGNLIPGPTGARIIQHGTPGWYARHLGLPLLADIPVPGDYDGNGVTDFAVYRRISETQLGHWLIRLNDAGGHRVGTRAFPAVWELSDDPTVQQGVGAIEVNFPVPGDYDGNGVTDLAIWHAPTGDWRIVLIDPAGNVLNRLDDGGSNTRRLAFGTPGGPASRTFPDVPIQAPISSLIKIGLLPGIPSSRFDGSGRGNSVGPARTWTAWTQTTLPPPPVANLNSDASSPDQVLPRRVRVALIWPRRARDTW